MKIAKTARMAGAINLRLRVDDPIRKGRLTIAMHIASNPPRPRRARGVCNPGISVPRAPALCEGTNALTVSMECPVPVAFSGAIAGLSAQPSAADDGAQVKLTLPLNPPSDPRFNPAVPEPPDGTTISATCGAKEKSPTVCVTLMVTAALVEPL